MTHLIISTPTGTNLDPVLRDTLDEAGLSATRFRVSGSVLRWAGRRGAYRAAVETLAATCKVSESTARREPQALVAEMLLTATLRLGRATQYAATTRLHCIGALGVSPCSSQARSTTSGLPRGSGVRTITVSALRTKTDCSISTIQRLRACAAHPASVRRNSILRS